MSKTKVIIMGAAGRDFHNFNTVFCDNDAYEVVASTATQIPNIDGRRYPPELAGKLYPAGIPIYPESDLTRLIKEHNADQVIFAYSDVPHEYVMHKASQALAAGADFRLIGPKETQIKSSKPIVSICAVRTGAGKSQTTRRVSEALQSLGYKVAAIRHPMPYGDLVKQAVQRFADYKDLDAHECTIEEREEYEPHIDRGVVIYAGVDYERILRQAEQEAGIVLWDGGNNDISFYKSDLHIVVADPHRPGHELSYHPGETNLRMADVVVINKIDTADLDHIAKVRDNIMKVNPAATVIEAASPIFVDNPAAINADGKTNGNATSFFGPYVDRLLVPQLRELAGVYGVDGAWVDGECWASVADYSMAALKAFRETTGIAEAPRKPGDPHWFEFLQFNREAFRRYLRDYIAQVKKTNPKFQLCSNWAYTDHMPEPVSAPVDFLSGDYTPQDSVNSARISARYLARQGKPWDLMAWSFTTQPGKGGATQKTAIQIEREAAVEKERPTIAGVYLNRLKDGMALDADPTIQYALGDARDPKTWWPQITQDDYQGVQSPYNTYLNVGLPPGPIASPGKASIDAALQPANVPYLYFVSRRTVDPQFGAFELRTARAPSASARWCHSNREG